ncbi:MAG: hypothetical protein WBB37_07580 [bacterium]
MAKDILGEVADEVFENVERQLKRTIESILDIPVSIGIPDAKWVKQYGYPMGAVMIGSGDIIDWIEDGNPETETTDGDKIIQEFAIAEAELVLSFHLAATKRVIINRLAFKFLKAMRDTSHIGEKEQYQLGKISFRDVLPDPEGERVFERIFSIPLSGTLTEKVVTGKGEVEYIGNVSASPDVLDQGT